MTRLTPVREIPNYAVIIRAIHERGASQQEALAELTRRGLWLTTQQKLEAGLDVPNPWGLDQSHPDFGNASEALDHAWHDAEWVIPERPSSERAKAAEMLMSNALKKFPDVALADNVLAIVRERVRCHFGFSGGHL